tara:strand:+ start:431 stop:943 length:513 start_codon:yes stop_codon:yes gene_type:complete
MNICIISGYFNPIHPGHLSMIQDVKAKNPDCTLVVIVNNDYQVGLKDSVPFLDEMTRCQIVQQIKGVDRVFLSIDKNRSVAKSLQYLIQDPAYQNYIIKFCNGGDRDPNSCENQEVRLCKKHNVEVEYRYGDNKTYSSSLIIKKAYVWMVKRRFWKNIADEVLSKLNIKP